MSASCSVCFQAENCDLETAISSLESSKFKVIEKEKYLTVSQVNGIEFDVYLVTDDFVQEEAMHISAGTKYENELSKCDARFEIVISDLDKALDEINSLIDVQSTLQDACNGYLFTPWNGNILEPQ